MKYPYFFNILYRSERQTEKIFKNSGSIIDMLSFVWSWPKGQAWTFMCANFQKGSTSQGRWLQLGHFFDQFGSHSKWSSREQHEWIFIVTLLKKNRSVPSSCYALNNCIVHTRAYQRIKVFEARVCIFNEVYITQSKLQYVNSRIWMDF